MNKATIEKALANALNSEPTISFAELASMPYIKMYEHDYITAQESKKTSAHLRQFALVAACCIFVMVSISGWYLQNRITSSTITLDVNPSIQIITNRKDQVLFVKALNEDAQMIIGEKDYKDTKLEETVVTLMNSLVDQKYLDQDKNTILLSVINKNSQKADAILAEVDRTIREILAAQNITPTIMRQIIAKETDRNELANKYHISEGKMNLIQSMIALNNKFTLDMLANMSIEQLLELAKESTMDLSEYLSIDDGEATPSKENSEDLQEDNEEEEDQEETSSIEDDNEQGEDTEDKEEDNEDDSEDQGEDNEDDSEDQGENNEKDSEDNQEDEDTYGNDDSNSDSQEKEEDDIREVEGNNDDEDQSDQDKIERDEEEEFGDGEGDEGDNEDGTQDQNDDQSDSGTIDSDKENEDVDQEEDSYESNTIEVEEDSSRSENESEEDSSENN